MNHKVVCDVCAEMKTFYFRKQLCSASVFVLKNTDSCRRRHHAETSAVRGKRWSVLARRALCPPAHPLTVTLLRVFKELRMGNKMQQNVSTLK